MSSKNTDMDYLDFLQSKAFRHAPCGFDLLLHQDWLFEFQQYITEKCLSRGKAAIFADTGLGKARMGLAWADQVAREADCSHAKNGLLVACPGSYC